MKTIYQLLVGGFLISHSVFAQSGWKSRPLPYQNMGRLSATAIQADDTLRFSWKEYSAGGLTNILMATVYLAPGDMDKLAQAIQYPANSSEQTKAELAYLIHLQKNRTQADYDRSLFLANIGYWPGQLNPTDANYAQNQKDLLYELTAVFDSTFSGRKLPQTARLLHNIMRDVRAAEFQLKYHFRRPRPYHLSEAVKPYNRMGSPAFPSGHTLWAFANAYLLSELVPDKRTILTELAEEIRWSREVLGIHYPSDNEAARKTAGQMLVFWKQNPKFRADLAKAKAEIAAKRAVAER